MTYPTTSPATATGAAWGSATTLVPDAATAVPSAANGGVTDHGLVYTYHIPRSGVDWNSDPPLQVSAADFIREFQAFCNPGKYPVGNSAYFTSTIAGFAAYCTAESDHFSGHGAPAVTAAAVAAWQDSHQIPGLSAPGPLTLRVTLMQQASDFNNIMALPFTSARAEAFLRRLPARRRRPRPSTSCPTARTRSRPTPRASISCCPATRPGGWPPTRSVTSTWRRWS